MFPNRLCLLLAKPFRWTHLLLSPLVRLVAGLSSTLLSWTGGRAFTGHVFGNREEIRFLMQEAMHNFTSDERAMITRVLDLQSVTLRQIAVPMANAVSVDAAAPMSEVLRLGRETQHTRLPGVAAGGRAPPRGRAGESQLRALRRAARFSAHGRRFPPARVVSGGGAADRSRAGTDAAQRQPAGHCAPARDRSERGLVSQQDILNSSLAR